MAAVTIRGVPEETMTALRARAKQNKRSVESEIRTILTNTTHPTGRLKLGSTLAALGKRYGGVVIEVRRDSKPFEGENFSS